jgi:hypothetical protein
MLTDGHHLNAQVACAESAGYDLELLYPTSPTPSQLLDTHTNSEDSSRKRMRLSHHTMEEDACDWALSVDCKRECKPNLSPCGCLSTADSPLVTCHCFNVPDDPMTDWSAMSSSGSLPSSLTVGADHEQVQTPDSCGSFQSCGPSRSAFRRLLPRERKPEGEPSTSSGAMPVATYQFCPQIVAAALESTNRHHTLSAAMHQYGPSGLSQRLGYAAAPNTDKV